MHVVTLFFFLEKRELPFIPMKTTTNPGLPPPPATPAGNQSKHTHDHRQKEISHNDQLADLPPV
jgi:hypothetical protein